MMDQRRKNVLLAAFHAAGRAGQVRGAPGAGHHRRAAVRREAPRPRRRLDAARRERPRQRDGGALAGGVLAELPDCFNQPIVAVAQDVRRPTVSALLMHDVGKWLVPATDEPVPVEQHERFLDHMAALHATFWERRIDVVSPTDRYLELSPRMAAAEAAIGSDHLVPRLVAQGWPLLEEVAPALARVVVPLVHEPSPLVDALDTTPQTFVHGNWKLDNLGTDDDGRTVLLDWELPGTGAAASDLAWYLAINCRRLPTTKEQTIVSYRAALERHGVATEPWWDRQLGLCLIGAMVQFGWEKALGGYDDELAWWEEQVVQATPLLESA